MDRQLAASLWRDASDLEDAGMLEAAIEKYELAVQEGSVDAMINLGNIYDDKLNPPKPEAAVVLYQRAIAGGSALAAWNLGKHYENAGKQEAAFKWMVVASKLGEEDAQAWIEANSRR